MYRKPGTNIVEFTESTEDVIKFLDHLNSLHPNVRFTHELGPREIAFLDTKHLITH